MLRVTGYLLLMIVITACGPSTTDAPARDGDAVLFETEVQTVVVRHCAFLGCHGREGMPLSLYAINYLRLRDPQGLVDSSRPVLEEGMLSAAELEHNRKGLAARVGVDDPNGDIQRFLRRLSPPSQGQIPHAGVTVFDRPDHPELDVLRRFLVTVR